MTPSSKCVGDLALYLVTRNLKADDLLDPQKASSIDYPERYACRAVDNVLLSLSCYDIIHVSNPFASF